MQNMKTIAPNFYWSKLLYGIIFKLQLEIVNMNQVDTQNCSRLPNIELDSVNGFNMDTDWIKCHQNPILTATRNKASLLFEKCCINEAQLIPVTSHIYFKIPH